MVAADALHTEANKLQVCHKALNLLILMAGVFFSLSLSAVSHFFFFFFGCCEWLGLGPRLPGRLSDRAILIYLSTSVVPFSSILHKSNLQSFSTLHLSFLSSLSTRCTGLSYMAPFGTATTDLACVFGGYRSQLYHTCAYTKAHLRCLAITVFHVTWIYSMCLYILPTVAQTLIKFYILASLTASFRNIK